MRYSLTPLAAAAAFLFIAVGAGQAPAADAVGSGVCKDCHRAETEVWQGTPHFKAFRAVHRAPEAKGILAAVGGSKNMKRNEVCTLCHYTMVARKAGAKASAKSGPSCESCHGAASEWVNIHNDYGGANAKKGDEQPAHRDKRMADASAAGMIWPTQKYDIAANCMSCHGLAHSGLEGKALAAMLGAGHPLNPDFEVVRYSQGTVRHRFYPPNVTDNAEMTPAELSRMFVEGQAAKLVSAVGAMGKSDEPKYAAAQEKRLADSKQALSALKSIPEAAALVAYPSDANARALVAAIAGKDLSAEVGGLLPAKDSYK